MSHHASAQPADAPFDPEICRAREMGIAEFAECLAANSACKYALAFGYGRLCKHPRRADIIRHTRRLNAAPDKTA